MLSAIWRLAPTHHSKVYCATKSGRRARFIANGLRSGGVAVFAGAWLADGTVGVAVEVGAGVGSDVGRAASEPAGSVESTEALGPTEPVAGAMFAEVGAAVGVLWSWLGVQ